MSFVYISAGVLMLCAAVLYVSAEYFFAFAFKRVTNKQPNDFADAFKRLLSGTDREYLLDEIARGKRFLREQPHADVSVTSQDGLKLCGKLYEHVGSDTTVIFVHGHKSAPDIDFPVLTMRFFRDGFNVLAIDQRASGKSEGKYYCFGTLERYDVEAWCRFVTERTAGSQKLVLFGCSMGASTVLAASALAYVKERVSAIIADCPYDSPSRQFKYILSKDYHLPAFPLIGVTSFLCKKRAGWSFDDFSASDAVGGTTVPILLIHGTADKYVPAEFSVDIFEVGKGTCEIMLVDGASHGFSFYRDPQRYLARTDDFLRRRGGLRLTVSSSASTTTLQN